MRKDGKLCQAVCLSLSLGGLFGLGTVAEAKSGEDYVQKEVWVTATSSTNYAVAVSGSTTTTDGDFAALGTGKGNKGGSETTYRNITIGGDSTKNVAVSSGRNFMDKGSIIRVELGGILNVEDTITIKDGGFGEVRLSHTAQTGQSAGIFLKQGELNAKNINIDATLSSGITDSMAQIDGLYSFCGGFNVTGDTYIKTVTGAKTISALYLQAQQKDNIFEGNITIGSVADGLWFNAGQSTAMGTKTENAYGIRLWGDGAKTYENKLNGTITIGKVEGTLQAWGLNMNADKATVNQLSVDNINATNVGNAPSAYGVGSSSQDSVLNINSLSIGNINSTGQAHGIHAYMDDLKNDLTIGSVQIASINAGDKAEGIYVGKTGGITDFGNVALGSIKSGKGAAYGIEVIYGDVGFKDIRIDKVENSDASQYSATGIEFGSLDRMNLSLNTANITVDGDVYLKEILAHKYNAYGIKTLGEGTQTFTKTVQVDSVKAEAVATGVLMSSKASEWNDIVVGKVESVTSVATGISAEGNNSGLSGSDKVVATVKGNVEVKEIHGTVDHSNAENAALEANDGATLDIQGGQKSI